jgi:hypothetical protein
MTTRVLHLPGGFWSTFPVDLNKLTMPEKIISASAIVLFLDSFMPWFKISFLGRSFSYNGWEIGMMAILPMFIGLVLLSHIVLTKLTEGVSLPDLPWPMVHMVGGIVAGALLVLKLLIGAEESGVDLDRAFGMFVGVLCGIGLAVGGWLYRQEAEGRATTM